MPGLSLGLIHGTVKTKTGLQQKQMRGIVFRSIINCKVTNENLLVALNPLVAVGTNISSFGSRYFTSKVISDPRLSVSAFRNPTEGNPAVLSSNILRKSSPVCYMETLEHEAAVKSRQYIRFLRAFGSNLKPLDLSLLEELSLLERLHGQNKQKVVPSRCTEKGNPSKLVELFLYPRVIPSIM